MDVDMTEEQGGAQPAESNTTGRPSRGAGNRIAKKRTKTGCLTCRKRRIKCGEEKPTCGNCIKSKRHCEGYNPRMLFRRTMSDTVDTPDHGQMPFGLSTPLANPQFPAYFSGNHFMLPGAMPPPQPLAPRPSDEESQFADVGDGLVPPAFDFPYDAIEDQERLAWMQAMQGHAVSHQLQSSQPAPTPHPQLPAETVYSMGDQLRFDPHDRTNSINPPVSPLSQFPGSWENDMKPTVGRSSPRASDMSPLTSHSSEVYGDINENVFVKHLEATGGVNGHPTGTPYNGNAHQRALSYQDHYDKPSQMSNKYRHFSAPTSNDRNYWPDITHALEQAAVEVEDDEYFDVQSDDEDNIVQAKTLISGSDSQRKLGVMLSLYQQNADELGVRSLDAFIYPGMLDTYRAEQVANPLKNPETARVFGHFISSTGPMLSCFERHPKSSAVMFNAGPVRSAQQSLWTYTLPMLALHNQGLLHAMLALGSLHIAKLSAASVTPSYKHYAWSIRRVHGAVSQGKKRHEVTTLAATLLLGFYEVMTADHMKWSTHLYGARQLIIEIDFAGMTRKIKEMKARRSLASLRRSSNNQQTLFDEDEEATSAQSYSFVDHFPDIDARLVSNLMGRAVRYDEYGRIVEDILGDNGRREYITHTELRNYEVLQDMFWWYCKHDVIHAILSGNKLLMEYDRWAACPPRAPMGVQSAAYGTFDHLLLLMGRIAQFTASDRPRKMKVAQLDRDATPQPTSGGHSHHAQSQARPRASSGMGVPSHGGQSSNPQQRQQPPPFYGMAPMNNNPHMPAAFRAATNNNQNTVDPRYNFTAEVEAATTSALEEWDSIRSALTIFAESLGPSYQPLSPEEHMPLDTPFGPSASYRGYDIGCVWMTYYLALIIHMRSHPSMPPASTMAVAKAARQTAQYANEIGRIAAGITSTLTVNSSGKGGLNPSLAGAFTECTLPLFFAGVQYQNDAQRRWTAKRLRDIEERSGWASAGICASGCEVSWQRQAERGGPPYERDAKPNSQDPCASGRSASGRANMSQQDERFSEYHTRSQLVGAFGLLGTADDLKRLAIDDSVVSPSLSGAAHSDFGVSMA